MITEKIIDYIAGIMNAKGATSYSFLGKGKVFHPETAMIITNKRLLLIVIPLPGAGEVIGNTNISLWQLMFAKKDIEAKLKKMISKMTLQQILNSNPKNYSIDISNISKAKISFFTKTLILTTQDNHTYKYSIRDNKDREKIKNLLKQFF